MLTKVWHSLRWFDSPILNRELRVLLRSRKAFLWLLLYLGVLFIAFTIAWAEIQQTSRDIAARSLFWTLVMTQGIAFVLLAPILTAGSLAGEHERRTFDILATTPLSGYHVVLAKCFSALCYVILLLLASLPVWAIIFLLGGVAWYEVVAAAVQILLSVLVAGMVGVACSAWIRRTFLALMTALMGIAIMGIFLFCGAGFSAAATFRVGGGGSGRVGYAALALFGLAFAGLIQILIFVGLTFIARNGYLAGTRSLRIRPKKVIRNVVVLKERRRRYPYYLIDPLKAPEPIPDGANPSYVRDKRHQPLGRLDFLIRISYVCLLISVILGLVLYGKWSPAVAPGEAPYGEFVRALLGVSNFVILIILAAAPLYASTAFSGEKEHGTFVPLMTTLMTPSGIVWAKLRIILRCTLFLIGALFLVAFLEMLWKPAAALSLLIGVACLLPFYVVIILATGLLGLYVSARSRRNMISMTVTYLLIALLFFGPSILAAFLDVGRQMMPRSHYLGGSFPFGLLDNLVCLILPLLSPFWFLSDNEDLPITAWNCYRNPSIAVLYLGYWLFLIAGLFWMTIRALESAVSHHGSLRPGGG